MSTSESDRIIALSTGLAKTRAEQHGKQHENPDGEGRQVRLRPADRRRARRAGGGRTQQLCGDTIRERVDRRHTNVLSVLIESFGFKHGLPADADFVFDLRCLPNPYWQPELRALSGLDEPVAKFLDADALFEKMYEDILAFLVRWIPHYVSFDRGYLTVAIGCTGGQHRSVHMTEKLAKALKKTHDPVLTRHSELVTHQSEAPH